MSKNHSIWCSWYQFLRNTYMSVNCAYQWFWLHVCQYNYGVYLYVILLEAGVRVQSWINTINTCCYLVHVRSWWSIRLRFGTGAWVANLEQCEQMGSNWCDGSFFFSVKIEYDSFFFQWQIPFPGVGVIGFVVYMIYIDTHELVACGSLYIYLRKTFMKKYSVTIR